MNLTLRSRLLLSFVAVVAFFGFFSALLGVRLIHRAVPAVQDVAAVDLSAAREFFRQSLSRISDAVRLTARQSVVRQRLEAGQVEALAEPLEAIQESQGLDLLVLTDLRGNVLLRLGNPAEKSTPRGMKDIVEEVVRQQKEIASPIVMSGSELLAESPALAARARIPVVATSHSNPEVVRDESAGMVLMAGAPVTGRTGRLVGVLCGGQLLNRETRMVDRVRSTLYTQEKYDGRDVAVISVFLGDKRVATSATGPSGARAVGTLVSENVYGHVALGGQTWVDRGFIIDDWYLTAYEPIRDLAGRTIGILGLGLLERKFNEAGRSAARIFFTLTMAALVLASVICFGLLNSIMKPVRALIAATEHVAAGTSLQDVKLKRSPPEIEALVRAFNRMQAALRERRRQNQEKLVRSDRLAMVGQLAAGVAHEINNPLGSILLFSRLVKQQAPADGRARENLERIEKETKRCHSIVQSLLDFSRQREPTVEPVDINAVLDSTLKLFENQYLFHNIELVRNYGDGLPLVEADPSQLQQVFMNIILNALDAMKGKGRLTLETGMSDEDGCIAVSIADTGCGIPPENMGRIFDPFFTTKGVGHGTGLGLSVSYGIVRKHEGDIGVSSSPGVGSVFTVTLPVKRESA